MSEPIHTAIVDDEPLARETLAYLLAQRPEFELSAVYGDGATARAGLCEVPLQLVFLDIQMPGENGLAVADALWRALTPETMPLLVFEAAYDQIAVQAFKRHACDYLLKPFKDKRFFDCLDRVSGLPARADWARLGRRLQALLADTAVSSNQSRVSSRISLQVDGDWVFLEPNEIHYVTAADHDLVVYTRDKRYLCRQSIANLAQSLGDACIQIHRSTLVHRDQVQALRKVAAGDFEILLRGGQSLPVSRRRLVAVKQALGLTSE